MTTQDPDRIDTMNEHELRIELREVLQQLFEAKTRPDWSLVDSIDARYAALKKQFESIKEIVLTVK